MTQKFINKLILFILAGIVPVNSYADFTPVCGSSVTVDQLVEVDDKNVKLTLFKQAQIIPRQAAAAYTLNQYLDNSEAAADFGSNKWKAVFESCLKQKNPDLAASSFLLYALSAKSKEMAIDTDYVQAVFLNNGNDSGVSKEISTKKNFDELSQEIKNIIFVSIGISDVHWLRVNLLGKSFYLSEEFKKFSEEHLTEALKVKKVKLAREISTMLEALYIANAEKYRKYTLACNLIEDLIAEDNELTSGQLITLVSIRNTDTALRPVIDPFLIEGFQTLASETLAKGKFDEALSLISSINASQATPTTYTVIKKIVASIDPASKVLLNDTVNELLVSSAANDTQLQSQLTQLYYERTVKLLDLYEMVGAEKSFARFQSISQDLSLTNDLKVSFATMYLQTGNNEAAKKIVATFNPSLGAKLKLFLDGYYGNPLFYVLFILVPLVIKLSYEFFNKVSKPAAVTSPEVEPHQARKPAQPQQAEASQPEEDISQFVSSNRAVKQKNHLLEEYKDCLLLFELQSGVDLKTIKTAYRNAVRKIHPDLNADNQSPDDASRFVELTKAYDRLRELHRLLGFETK